jgi:hypothetical protein
MLKGNERSIIQLHAAIEVMQSRPLVLQQENYRLKTELENLRRPRPSTALESSQSSVSLGISSSPPGYSRPRDSGQVGLGGGSWINRHQSQPLMIDDAGIPTIIPEGGYQGAGGVNQGTGELPRGPGELPQGPSRQNRILHVQCV